MSNASQTISRRAVLAGLAGLGAAPSFAKAPFAPAQAPSVHRYRVGDIEVTAIGDGYFELDTALIPRATPEEVAAIQRREFLPEGQTIRGAVNAYLVNTGDSLTLVDAGARDYFGPTVGKLLPTLAAAGVTPDMVDRIVLTHMHPDHIGGVMDTGGNAVFANATLHAHSADHAFWLDDAIRAQAPEGGTMFWDVAMASAKPYDDRTELFDFGADLGGGISTFDMAGHTPGHTGIRISSGNDQMLILGDIVHAAPLQLAHPDWSIAFDVDQEAAAAARMRALDMVAADRLLIAGMHIPFPGVGHIERAGEGFGFVPAPWRYSLE